MKKGKLQRKIKVITIKEQQFTPAWVGTRVWGHIDETSPTENRAHVTVMFTIPENCPAELFPLRVLVSSNELDIRSAAGVSLPVISEGEAGYGEPNGIGYKYVYEASAPGVQRIYFENVLNQGNNEEGTIILEAEHFESLTKTFTFSEDQYTITVEGLEEYNAENPGSDYPTDETIYYRAGAPETSCQRAVRHGHEEQCRRSAVQRRGERRISALLAASGPLRRR